MQCGSNHTVIQMNDGRWFVFGSNYFGQLGIGITQLQETPIELPSPIVGNENDSKDNQFINIFCGDHHNIGITENGDCYGWGYNGTGQLGLGNINGQLGLGNINGQLGLDNCEKHYTPIRLKEAPSSTVNQIQQRYIWFSCGRYHTVVLTNLGIVVLTVQQLLI